MPAKKNIITGLTMMILTVFICVSMCVPICGNSESDNGRSITLICRKGDTVLTQEFDLDEIKTARLNWGLFRDRRPECYKTICMNK